MNPLINFIQTTTYELTPDNVRLPSFFWAAFTALNRVHSLWRWYRRIEVYRNPDNLVQLLAGHALNFVLGDTLLLRVAGQCLLVSTRLLDCAQEQAALYRSGSRFISAIKGNYSPSLEVDWKKLNSSSCLSPSTIYWWKTNFHTVTERISRIAAALLNVGKHVLKLSMKIMDVIDAFCWSPDAHNDAINESFVNIHKWLSRIVEQKEELLQGIIDNKMIIEKLLERSPMSYEQLQEGVANILEKAETVHQGAEAIYKFGGKAALAIGKKATNRGMVAIGLAEYRPDVLVIN